MKIGDIIYHEELIFSDGIKDVKKKRPCMYLYEETIDDITYTYSIPITSKVKSLNYFSDRVVFIPDIISGYRKLSFAKIGNIVKSKSTNIIPTGRSLSSNTIIHIIDRILEYQPTKEKKQFYEKIKQKLKTMNQIEPKKVLK